MRRATMLVLIASLLTGALTMSFALAKDDKVTYREWVADQKMFLSDVGIKAEKVETKGKVYWLIRPMDYVAAKRTPRVGSQFVEKDKTTWAVDLIIEETDGTRKCRAVKQEPKEDEKKDKDEKKDEKKDKKDVEIKAPFTEAVTVKRWSEADKRFNKPLESVHAYRYTRKDGSEHVVLRKFGETLQPKTEIVMKDGTWVVQKKSGSDMDGHMHCTVAKKPEPKKD